MMQPAYPAAREAALLVHGHFERHLTAAGAGGGHPGVPDVESMQAIVDAAFWASLRREEGLPTRISLALVAPEHVPQPLRLERSLRLSPHALTRVAPAVERPGIHLGVTREEGELRVWGTTRILPPFSFVLEVVTPGLLVIKHSREEGSGKFVNVAVIEGDQIKVIDERAASLPDCPALLMSLLGLEQRHEPDDSVSLLIQIAASMRAHGRGGTLLVVPANSEAWRDSILQPITYAVQPSFSAFAGLIHDEPGEQPHGPWQDALRRAVEGLAGLTAVDGATVITDQYDLLAFGAKIVHRPGWPQVSRVAVTEPIAGTAAVVADPTELGGTRHFSAAQFTHDQRDAIAMVASQDGRFTVFGWSPCAEMVQAHLIETLLL